MWDTLIITPFTNVLLLITNLVGQNFGISIILFTLLIRLLTHPLTVQQLKASAGLQQLQTDPRYIEMQKKYKDDKEKLAQAQMELYKELGINPLGSCLPMLIQFPLIIGLYQTITKAMASTPLELLTLTRHLYPFMDLSRLVPFKNTFLWFELGQPERLNLPFLPFGIPILAILVFISTYVQSKLMAPPPNGQNDQTAQMTNMMNLYMPFFMGYLALTLASGLSLYFITSNLIGVFQYAMLGKVTWSNLIPSFLLPKKQEASTKNRGTHEQRKDNARNNRSNR